MFFTRRTMLQHSLAAGATAALAGFAGRVHAADDATASDEAIPVPEPRIARFERPRSTVRLIKPRLESAEQLREGEVRLTVAVVRCRID